MSESNSETPARPPARQKYFALICLVLALGTVALYWPITHHPFIEFDDTDYIVGNPHVTSGLSATNFVWAFTTSEQANWHPVTWLSHQADCALFGLEPGWHHLVNLLYHVANTLLLFIFLRSATGAVWRSALVAALFAWHPMHVESVAWASERKDMLSTFFWLLTLLAYLGYARAAASAPPRNGRVAGLYVAALCFCACGLMSKPMAVTLPFALGLLDLWPLNRIAGWQTPVPPGAGAGCRPVSARRLVLEKIPFLALAVAGSVTTYLVQSRGGAVAGMPVMERLANAVLAYARYTAKLFWPTDLAVIYPHPRHWPLWLALIAVGLLLVWTFLCVCQWRKCPYLAVGWFWFLGTLVPTIGLVQVGAQAMADRYTYIPSIGLFVAVIWGVAEYCSLREPPRWLLPAAAGVMLAGCVTATARDIGLWHDSVTLFRHAITVTTDNYVAENCLGKAYEKLGDNEHALACYELSVKTESRFPYSQFNLAIAQLGVGRTAEALQHLEIAAALEPREPDIQFDLGIYFFQHGSWTNAVNCFSNALAVRPNFARAQFDWGNALANLDRPAEAASHFRTALRLDSTLTPAKTNLDRLLAEHPEAR
jgi:tetratricopeptide (TPR) repeat protein